VNKKSPNWGLRGGSEKGMKMHMTSIRCASFLPVLAAAIGLIAGCYVPGEESAATPLPPPQQVEKPQLNYSSGTYSGDLAVEITDATPEATIRYTTDGSDPTSPSAVLGGSMEVKGPGTWKCFKAYAGKPGMSDSTVATAVYGIAVGFVLSGGIPNKVICAELHRQGLMDDAIYAADEAFGRYLRYNQHDVLLGYQLWAKPVAQWMQKSRMVTNIVASLATPWSYEMAYRMGARDKGNAEGKILMDIGVPVCRAIGRAMIWIENVSLLD
jgi:hypothetical protein